jgi:hypothetical protein
MHTCRCRRVCGVSISRGCIVLTGHRVCQAVLQSLVQPKHGGTQSGVLLLAPAQAGPIPKWIGALAALVVGCLYGILPRAAAACLFTSFPGCLSTFPAV